MSSPFHKVTKENAMQNINLQQISEIQVLFAILGKKATVKVLTRLRGNVMRYNTLQKQTGLGPRTLSERLKELESLQLVNRVAFAEVPPRVEYNLTLKGEQVAIALSSFMGNLECYFPEEVKEEINL
jgi:DNA-binding HxlR family transcriptional regulator